MPERKGPSRKGQPTLSRQAWADAALDALAERGVAAVAVEPLAAALGVTKGSFYWHFRTREDLLAAALERWHERETEEVIAALQRLDDPAVRLRRLFDIAFRDAVGGGAEAALLAATDSPVVAAAVRQVTTRRLAYLAELFTDLGVAPGAAEHAGLLAYTSYVGFFTLQRAEPAAVPRGPALDRYLDDLLAMLSAAAGARPSPAHPRQRGV